MEEHHIPVLLNESISYLITDTDGVYFDATLGFGGHTTAFLKTLTDSASLVATEVDADAFNFCRENFKDEKRLKIYNANFRQIDIVSKIEMIGGYDGIFADLGVSSFQLDNPESGFTYRVDSRLDLRLDKTGQVTAADIINSFSEEDLATIFYQYGEEKNSRKIARTIVQKREQKKIKTTLELSAIIEEITPPFFLVKTLSRVFQALRIYINDELGALKEFLSKSIELLKPKGRLVLLTYHSLEDKTVKEFFKFEALDCICPPGFPVCQCGKNSRLKILTKKPLLPQATEINYNRRARSAKLRASEKK